MGRARQSLFSSPPLPPSLPGSAANACAGQAKATCGCAAVLRASDARWRVSALVTLARAWPAGTPPFPSPPFTSPFLSVSLRVRQLPPHELAALRHALAGLGCTQRPSARVDLGRGQGAKRKVGALKAATSLQGSSGFQQCPS
jgi:hypothetical protein